MARAQGTVVGEASRRQRAPAAPLELPHALEEALNRTAVGLHNQGVALRLPSRSQLRASQSALAEAIRAHTQLPLLVVSCSQHTRVPELAARLGEALGTEFSERDPQSFMIADPQPQVLLLSAADLLPNAGWRLILTVMKKCSRKNWPLLVVTSSVDSRELLSRLYSIDQDSSMMWRADELNLAGSSLQ